MCNVAGWRKFLFRPLRLIIAIFLFTCVQHLFQIYLACTHSLQKTKQTQHFLFLAQERNVHLEKQELVASNARKHISLIGRNLHGRRASTTLCQTRSVLFLKTHKTGSTTVTNIILRYAVKHNLKVGLPLPRQWELGGYPAKFDSQLVLPRLEQYDVLCHHIRYNHKAVRRVLPPNANAITIIRDPAKGFESGFAFFRDWPYPKWFKNMSNPVNLKLFLDQPYAYYDVSTPWHFRAKNYMAFDLGFDHDRNDLKYANTVIEKVEEWFDLVLITDRMDESLLLLKDLLCMESLEEIAYLRLKVRQDFARREVTSEMETQMRAWNLLDTKLYAHFNKVLSQKIANYGRRRMREDLRMFRKKISQLNEKCVKYYDEYKIKPWISRIELKEDSGGFCEMLSWGEVKFGDYVREFQEFYVRNESFNQPNIEEIKSLFKRTQANIIGEEAAKNSAR